MAATSVSTCAVQPWSSKALAASSSVAGLAGSKPRHDRDRGCALDTEFAAIADRQRRDRPGRDRLARTERNLDVRVLPAPTTVTLAARSLFARHSASALTLPMQKLPPRVTSTNQTLVGCGAATLAPRVAPVRLCRAPVSAISAAIPLTLAWPRAGHRNLARTAQYPGAAGIEHGNDIAGFQRRSRCRPGSLPGG